MGCLTSPYGDSQGADSADPGNRSVRWGLVLRELPPGGGQADGLAGRLVGAATTGRYEQHGQDDHCESHQHDRQPEEPHKVDADHG